MRHYRYEYEATDLNGNTLKSGGAGSFLNEFQLKLFIPSFYIRRGFKNVEITSVTEVSEKEMMELKKNQ